MIVRHGPISKVAWGNGTSERYIVAGDGFGYGLNDTVIHAGTRSKLQYRNHIEAVYCIGGHGWVKVKGGELIEVAPGTLYVLNDHDAHELIASEYVDWRVICVFTPGLVGDEVHSLSADGYSGF